MKVAAATSFVLVERVFSFMDTGYFLSHLPCLCHRRRTRCWRCIETMYFGEKDKLIMVIYVFLLPVIRGRYSYLPNGVDLKNLNR